eukprot:8009733-Pyramimonas_sp.AAC.1
MAGGTRETLDCTTNARSGFQARRGTLSRGNGAGYCSPAGTTAVTTTTTPTTPTTTTTIDVVCLSANAG